MSNCKFDPKCRYSTTQKCCLKTLHPLFGIKGAATNKGCGIRLRELNSARKPSTLR